MARKIINKNKKNSIRKQDDNQKRKKTPKTAPTQKYNKNTNKNTKNINKIPVMNWFLTDNNTHDQSTQNHYKDVHKPRPSQPVSFLNIARGENQPLKE